MLEMREPRSDRPVLLEGEDIDGTSRQFRGWRIEVIHLGRGPIARCGAVIPFDDMRISLVQVRRATILRGITPDDEVTLLSTSPSSPPVRVGSRPIDSGVCLMLGTRAQVEIYLPENCCAFMLSLPSSRTNGATTRLSAAPAKGQAEFRALAAEHSALLNKCMDLLEAFRRSSAPKVIATQVQLRLRELLAPAAAKLFALSRPVASESKEGSTRRQAVARACAYIDKHLNEQITLEDLCTVAGVRARTLEYAFRKCYEVGPVAYLRSVRLCRVRRDLRNSRRVASVAKTARRWRFTHMGQFGRDYRLLFGESPSSTLARSRGHLAQVSAP
jgi:AraC family transcriptional regulator, ethanolamine operon transcriptional activator